MVCKKRKTFTLGYLPFSGVIIEGEFFANSSFLKGKIES